MANVTDQVHEMQGLYGPFTLSERVMQKIWLRQDFDARRACLFDGRALTTLRPGRWNLLAGPDFRGALLRIGEREIGGDVELHLHASDWRAHGHDRDAAYDGVALHVVMFPPPDAQPVARLRTGEPLPTLVLLPLLNRGLEEYASDDALERLTARDAAERLAELATLPPAELRTGLLQRARMRWEQKVGYAHVRLQKLGMDGAAHHAALEILGYRHNRAVMLATATRHPLEEWRNAPDVQAIYAAGEPAWQMQGVRPANHPLRRLRQYAAWVAQVPDWPDHLSSHLTGAATTGRFAWGGAERKRLQVARLREGIQAGITGNMLTGSRLDNLVCDGLLPLLSAASGKDLLPLWFNWFVGDVPAEVRHGLASLDLTGPGVGPQSHGWAQGLLGWMIERDSRASG